MKKMVVVIFATLLVVVSFAGCATNEEESNAVNYSPEYNEEDSWTFEEEYEDDPDMTVAITVVDTDADYQGESAEKGEIDVTMEDYENETVRIEDFSGSGEIYIVGASTYREMEMKGTYHLKESGQSLDMTIEMEDETKINGRPDEIEVGDEWSVTRTVDRTTRYIYEGDVVSEDSEKEIQTREYEALEETERSVTAGTFETIKLEWSEADDSDHGEEYYSEEVKEIVERVNYGDETTRTELLSYSLG